MLKIFIIILFQENLMLFHQFCTWNVQQDLETVDVICTCWAELLRKQLKKEKQIFFLEKINISNQIISGYSQGAKSGHVWVWLH